MIIEGIAGVITGLIGNVVTAITNYKTQKLKNAHEVQMTKLETEAMLAETQANIQITETKTQGELAIQDARIFKESIKAGSGKLLDSSVVDKLLDGKYTKWVGTFLVFLLGVADTLRGIMRPVLTLYLVGLTSWITYQAADILAAKATVLTASMAAGIFTNVTGIVVYLAATAVAWWFGDRSVQKYIKEMNNKPS